MDYTLGLGTSTAPLNSLTNNLIRTGASTATSPTATLNSNVVVNIATTTNFGNSATPYYSLIQAFGGLTPGSTTNGWVPQLTGTYAPTANTYADFVTTPSVNGTFVDLHLYTPSSTPTITPTGTSENVIQAVTKNLDFYQGGSVNTGPVVTAPVQDGNGVTTYNSSNFYIVNQAYSSVKTNSFSAISNTILVSSPNVQANVLQLYNSGFEYLAAQVGFVDPPATTTPFYVGETFNNPGGLSEIIPVVLSGNNWDIASTLDTQVGKTIGGVVDGRDNVQGYNGSFLSYVDSLGAPFSSITDPGNLTAAEWTELDGSFGVDFSNDIAWSVLDYSSGDFSVVGGPTGTVVISSTPLPSSLAAGLLLMLGMGLVTLRKMRQVA
jgi:hypothetical protein